METDTEKVIDEGQSNCDRLSCKILLNAFQTMTESLVKMEKGSVKPEVMMDKCVWPILHEAGRRVETIAEGDTDVPEGGFEFVVG